MESKSPNKAIIGIIVIALIAVAATAVIVMSSNNKANDTTTTSEAATTSNTDTQSTTNNTTTSATSFKDGTYTATGSYQTPGGSESIGVTLTLSSGTITDASVQQNASGGEAEEYQSRFASGFKSQVVGKKITDVSLSRVAGSSLTPNGFNNALQTIEEQAKA